MNKLFATLISIFWLINISSIGMCDESNKQVATLSQQLQNDGYDAFYKLKQLMVGPKEAWEIVLQFSHKEPKRYVYLTQQVSMEFWVHQNPQYFSYLYQRAEVDDLVARNEAVLWDIGWHRKPLEVVSSNTRVGDLESKDSAGARKVAIEFIKRKAGEDFGFIWNEQPDSIANKKAVLRINNWLAGPKFARVNQGGDFVIATVVNVRSEPSMTGSIVGRLRIGTRVDVLQTVNGWTEILFIDRMLERLHGYIATEFLAPTELGLYYAINTARMAIDRGNMEEALVFAERAFAINGSNFDAGELLQFVYLELNRAEEVAQLDRLLEGRRTEYLAICAPPNGVDDSAQILLLSKFSPESGLQRVTWQEEATDLLVQNWYYITTLGEQAQVEPGTFFLSAKLYVLEFSNEYFFSIGKDCQPGTIYSTSPIGDVIKTQSNWQRTINLLKPLQEKILQPDMRNTSWVQSIESYRLEDGNLIDSVMVQYIVRYIAHHDLPSEPTFQTVNAWALSTPDGSILKTIGYAGDYLESVREISWARWISIPGKRIGIILHEVTAGMSRPITYDIVVISEDGKVQSLKIVVLEGGC